MSRLLGPHTIQIGERPYAYTIRRSRRAKHILLHVDLVRGIALVLPWRSTLREGQNFIRCRRQWLERVLRKQQYLQAAFPARQFISGEALPFCGRTLRLRVTIDTKRQRARVIMAHDELWVTARHQAQVRSTLAQWYHHQAQAFFLTQCIALAKRTGTTFTKLSIGEHRTQWGSCTRRGRLSFNWRLLLAPPAVAMYVAAHEVAHLRYPHHQPAFWQQVATLNPPFETARRWLKRYGHGLVL